MQKWTGVWLVAVALSMAIPAAAWQGRLVRADGSPVRGARIQILGERETVVVAVDGTFVLPGDPQPPFDLLVTRTDGVVMQPIRVTEIPSSGVVEVRLAPMAEGSVTVLGAVPDLELPPAAALTVIGQRDLEQRGPRQLGDVLATIPGTEAVGNGPAAVPAVRGMTGGRTLILLDDGRVTAERRAGASATFLDPATVEEVEVVRGPGSVAYGSDAFGGLIRLRTGLHAPGDAPELAWTVTGGTGDNLRAVAADYGFDTLGGGLVIGAHWRDYDNYRSPDGEVPNSGWRGYGGRVGYQAEVGRGVLHALWRTDLARDIGKPADNYASRRVSYPEENSHRFNLGYEQAGPGSWSRFAVNLSWAEYQLLTSGARFSDGVETERTLADVFSHDWGLRLEAERGLGDDARLVVGLDASGRIGLRATNEIFDLAPDGTAGGSTLEVSVKDAEKSDLGVFAGASTSVGSVGLSGGLRLDRIEARNRGGYFGDDDRSDTALSGFVAATVPLADQLELSAQVARGFRDALLSDRYYRGITGRGDITGNPDLEPETSRQLDVALRYTPGQVTVAGYAYWYRIEDLIERYKTGGDYFFRNRGEAEIRGFELEVLATLGHGVLAQAAVQLQRGEIRDDGSDANDIPSDGVILTLRRDPAASWWWLVRGAVYARDDRPGASERVVPGYAALDLGVGIRIAPGLEAQLLGRNLLDRSYLDSADENAVLAPGRSLEVTLRGSF